MRKPTKTNTFSLLGNARAWEKALLLLIVTVTVALHSAIPTASAAVGAPKAIVAVSTYLPALYSASADEYSEDVQPNEVKPSVQDILLEVCKDHGYGEDCAKVLLGMLWKESNNIPNAIGDRGLARGYFQIHVKLHRVTVGCAEDLRCSAEWSLNYLEHHGYPRSLMYAIQCHNSCLVNNGYAASARRHGLRLWDIPMEYRQTEEYQIATVDVTK
jgi:hypothetical protein